MDKLAKGILDYTNAQIKAADTVWCLNDEFQWEDMAPLSPLVSAVNKSEGEVRKAIDYLVSHGYAEYKELRSSHGPIVIGFYLTHEGLHYKEIRYLTNKEKWKERIWGFIAGALVAIVANLISSWCIGGPLPR